MVMSTLYGWEQNSNLHKSEGFGKRNEDSLKISIVIPTLNQAETLEDTLFSITNQNYSNYEIIVMDGGSCDGTSGVIHRYRDWIEHYHSGKDGGQSQAINKGFRQATGQIYAWINSDDFYLPGAFDKVIETFNNSPEIDIVVGAGDIVTIDCKFLKHISSMEMNRANLIEWHKDKWIMQQSCFWSSSIWKMSGGVDETLKLLMDFDLWLRFSELGKSLAISDKLAVMRYYSEAKTVSLKKNVREEEAYVYAKNGEFAELRRVITELVENNSRLTDIIEEYNKSLVSRILRKLRLWK